MVRYSNSRAASLLDSAGPGTCRPPYSRSRPPKPSPPAEVHDRDDALVVRVPLCEGPVELRVPRAEVKPRQRHSRHQIETPTKRPGRL
jgi:hypothetical protein